MTASSLRSAETGERTGQIRPLPLSRRLSVLLLCDDYQGHANTVLDHIAAFTDFSAHDVRVFNPIGMTRSRHLDLDEFDAVVIHYSIKIVSEDHLAPAFREQLRRYQGLKVQFIQDEYRSVNDFTELMRVLGIRVLYTLLAEPEIPKLYDETRLPGVVKLTTWAGFVPKGLTEYAALPPARRPIDIGYRGRTLPFWLGILGQEKAWIAQGVRERAGRYGLRCDIGWAEEDRIYGRRWIEFVASCKATLGTESGSSITDFDGSIEQRTKAYLLEHPRADFQEVHRALLRPHEDNVRVTAISPRIFEAAALRTALILFPGTYSGLIDPWVHYIPLAKDFSNLDRVVEKLRDVEFLETLTERAHRDLIASGRFSQQAFAQEFDGVLLQYGARRGKRRKLSYRLACLERPCAMAASNVRESLHPILRVPQDAVKAALAVALLLMSEGGRQIATRYLTSRELRRSAPFGELLRDVLKLAVVGQTMHGMRTSKKPFRMAVRLQADEGRIVFESLRGQEPGPGAGDGGDDPKAEAFWRRFGSVVQERRLQLMVWNHAALGGNVRYRLAPFAGLTVCVGDYDMHAFAGLVELARRAPQPAWAFLSSMLHRRVA
ncbi:MAG: hypothetical protein KGO52_04155 [Nitrospirota bacterium]|nr:hypothetical protein [Nitrospirota bacterium]MDE3117379.1 hypothetical protein [Nitrospirota bacterium]MDE3241900.1 hypothetical protein [Nitrospirota bacterium]